MINFLPIVDASAVLQSQSLDAENGILQDTGQWVLECDLDWHFFAHHTVTSRLKITIRINTILDSDAKDSIFYPANYQ